MFGTLGIVHARTGTQQSRRNAERTLGGKSVLEWVVRRATECQQLDRVIVLAADGPQGDSLAELVPPDITVFRAKRPDPLGRFIELLDAYPAQAAVRIGLETPLVDPVLIDRLVNTAAQHPANEYIGYRTSDGKPAVLSRVGALAEWFRVPALRKANREAKSAADRDEATRYLYSHPELFSLRLISLPAELESENLLLTMDFEKHWESLQAVFDSLGPDQFDWHRVANMLEASLAGE